MTWDWPTAVGDVPAGLAVDATAGLEVTLTTYARDDGTGTYGATHFTETIGVALEVDCGDLRQLPAMQKDCNDGADSHIVRAEGVAGAGAGEYAFTFTAGALAGLFPDGVPVTGVHAMAVRNMPGGDNQVSHYAAPTNAAGNADPAQADVLDEQTWHPVFLLGEPDEPQAPQTGDGFTARIEVDNPVGGPVLAVVPDEAGDVVFHATVYEGTLETGYTPSTQGVYMLRLYHLDDGTIQRYPESNGDGAPDGCASGDVCQAGPDGRFTWTVPAADLPRFDGTGGNGFTVQVHKIHDDWSAFAAVSQLFLPKEALLTAGEAAAAPAADALDTDAFTPFFVHDTPTAPTVGDGFVATIEPRNALRTPLGSIVESNVRGNYVFDVCAFDADGLARPLTHWRLEFWAAPEEPAAPDEHTFRLFAVGSHGPVDIQVPAHDGSSNCIVVEVPSIGSQKAAYQQFIQASFWVEDGGMAMYSEAVNALADQGQHALADEVDRGSASGIRLVARHGSPLGFADLSLEHLLRDPAGFLQAAQDGLAHLLEGVPSPPPVEDLLPPIPPEDFPSSP